MRGVRRGVKPMLLAGSQNDVVGENDSHRTFGGVFRRLIRVMPPPRRDPGPITFDRRKTGHFRRLEGGEDVRRSFIRIESRVVHDLPKPPLD
jgi:hypothetical protein